MAEGLKTGDRAYIIESNRIIRECTVLRGHGNMYIIKFENGGGIQVKGHRLFKNRDDAEASIPGTKSTDAQKKYRSPYYYWH